jgi:hypothetical protein
MSNLHPKYEEEEKGVLDFLNIQPSNFSTQISQTGKIHPTNHLEL